MENIILSVKTEHISPSSRRNGYIIASRTETEDILKRFIWCKKVFIHRDVKNTQFRKYSCYLRHYKVLVQSDPLTQLCLLL